MTEIRRSAVLSRCGKYRYALGRTWDASLPEVGWIMLNPSTADSYTDDPTIRRVVNFTRSWGYGGVCVVNLFAYRATKLRDLLPDVDIVGPKNDHWLNKFARNDGIPLWVAAWGSNPMAQYHISPVRRLFLDAGRVLHCLHPNGTPPKPTHPLYLPRDSKLSLLP